jgi:acyl phosphate:glycerol-3-phosphate acyltransferase
MTEVLIILAAYFIGAIPFAYIFGRLFNKVDIRQVGTGNVGAANTFKHLGKLPGLLTLLADTAKAFLAVLITIQLSDFALLPLIVTFTLILGHNYSIFLRFKGGKGLASLIGAMLLIEPVAVPIVFSCIMLTILIMRESRAATGVGIFSLPVVLGLLRGDWIYFAGGLIIVLLITTKHLKNFREYKKWRIDRRAAK